MSKVNIPKSLISRVDNSESYVRFVRRAKPIAQRMVNEYTAKQRAFAAVNTQYNKTGQIDMTRIAQVYTSDDIFIKKTIAAAGQSHGLLLVIDWSGSMHGHIESMAMQYLVTALFAKRANIPLAVYIFTTPAFGEVRAHDSLGNELSMRLILNTLVASESDIIEIFYHMICTYHSVYDRIIRESNYNVISRRYHATEVEIALSRHMSKLFSMGGTPLVQATSQAYICAHRMKIRESLQNMTVMFITDGVGTRMTDGKTNENITTLVCPFTSRRFDSRIDKPRAFYRSHGMGALSAVNEMMASQGIKSINLFVGSNARELAEVVYMVSCENVDDDDVIRQTLHKTRRTELYDFGSIGNYTRYVALMANMFPKIDDVGDDDALSNGKGATLQRRFTTSTNDTKNITRICSILVDEICADFKIK